MSPFSDLQVLTLICFLPHLEDLKLIDLWVAHRNGDNTGFQPPTSPPLTGTLTVDRPRGVEHLLPGLLELPNCIRFRKVECLLDSVVDIRWTVALVEACSNTLERVEIRSHVFGKSLQL